MRTALGGYRLAILIGIGLLILLLAAMATNLMSQLRELSTADGDNTQWSILQLDTEFANLSAALSTQIADETPSQEQIRLRLDIALSRLAIINSGRVSNLLADSDEAQALIIPLRAYVDQVVAIADRPDDLSKVDFQSLKALTENVRPNVRKIALLGVSLSAKRSEQRRDQFSNQLILTGGTAIILLFLMAGLMVFLNRLLNRARQRDAALLASSQRLESTVAASLDGIVTADATGHIIEYNEAAERIFGWTREEILGHRMDATIIPEKFREAHINGMKQFLETGIPKVVNVGRIELTALRKTGEEFPVEMNITVVREADGSKFIAYLRDISERKINEQDLIDARDRAQRTDRAKSQFLTIMSHEMRTPLNGILGVLDLLKVTRLTEKQKRYTKIAAASSEILLEHINEALDITRIEAGPLVLTPQDFRLEELVSGVVDALEPLASEKGLELLFRYEDHMRMAFHGDNNRIRQILTNLVGNAIKFTETGLVKITVDGIHAREETSLQISVSDTGPGIAAENLERIFEDFVALAHAEGRQSRGDGLGLSISRKIARQMGGDLQVGSEIGHGTTFTLSMPLKRVVGAKTDGDVHKGLQSDENTNAPACDILVVEDNGINRKVLKDMLRGMGHRVTEAVNGLDCLELADKKRFDLIFIDIGMPVMNGIEATRRLREGTGLNALTPIVGLTAHGREEYRKQAELSGMTRFYTKPIRLFTLQEIMTQMSPRSDIKPEFSDDINDTLRELCSVLGVERTLETGNRFFTELSEMCDAVLSGKLKAKSKMLTETSHKMKGAAAMLGLHSLENRLAELERASPNDTAKPLRARIEALRIDSVAVRQGFRDRVKRQPGSRK